MATQTTDTPRIYVACLASYNAGILHGRWIDADTGADEIREEIEGMLAESPEYGAEEWAIHDYECFCGLSLGEYTPTETVAEYGRLIAEHGPAYVRSHR
jgi:antirestriction protein